jgi:hypothetical protein
MSRGKFLNSPSTLPPAARGALFEKTAPVKHLDPPQKLLIIFLFLILIV